MRLKYKCKECGTSIGFEGLCWKCRAKQHRKEVNNWSVEEIEEKKNQVINSIKSLGDEKFYSIDEFDLFGDLMTRGIDCKEIAKAACEYELYYPSALYYVNTIGGFASWVQDWEYRECPECGKKMRYLAQIHWDTIEDFAEGTLYIEICTDCKVITMFHQQT